MLHYNEFSFHIRHYECDATGNLNQAAFLRYMQESAYQASAAVGYGMVSYENSGRSWFIRESEVIFLTPVKYGQELIVKTWVEDFHRVRSIRGYEIFTNPDRTLVLRGWSDWVYLDRNSRKPVSIPNEMIYAFYPDWKPEFQRPRSKTPDLTIPDKKVYYDHIRVTWGDVDPVMHVNNAAYFAYFDDCWRRAFETVGWSLENLFRSGIVIQNQKAHLEYRSQAVWGDKLEIATWISNANKTSWIRHFRLTNLNNGSVLVEADFDQVFHDKTTMTPRNIPDEIIQLCC